MDHFELVAPYAPTGDQPEAIAKLTEGVENGLKEQVLLGVTGSGKTFTMANTIANINRPTLVLAHNKTWRLNCAVNFESSSQTMLWSILSPMMKLCRKVF